MRDRTLDDAPFTKGALRSRIVARLSGATLRQLGYWHRTGLIRARALPGGAGRRRLYSWEDYMKVRAAKKLKNEGLTMQRIRTHIAFLDSEVPQWPYRDVREFARGAIVRLSEPGVTYVTAEPGLQGVFPELALSVLSEISEEGVLGQLRNFEPFVSMDPFVLSGNPVVRGTRIETRFISSLVDRDLSEPTVRDIYHLTREQVSRAVEFERLAA